MQDCSISIASTLEILQSWTKPSNGDLTTHTCSNFNGGLIKRLLKLYTMDM